MTLNIQNFALQYSGVDFSAVLAAAPNLFITEAAPISGTPNLSDAQVAQLTAAGTKVLGYVESSVTDDNRPYWNTAWTSDGTDTGTVNASAPAWLKTGATNPFGIVTDFRDAGWKQIVINQAVDLVTRGYSGIFLDDVSQYYTLGNAIGGTSALATAMMELVVEVKAAITAINPNAVVVVNSTPYIVTDGTGGINSTASQAFLNASDGLMLEVLMGVSRPAEEAALQQAVQFIKPSMTVITLEYGGSAYQNYLYNQQSRALGFVPGVSQTAAYNTLSAPITNATANADILNGTARADRIEGFGGNDFINGGAGEDTAIFSGSFANYTVSFNANTSAYTVISAADGSDTITGVEFFQFSDALKTAAEMLQPAPPLNVINGTKKANILSGTANADQINGLSGNDKITAGAGNDMIDGGKGTDTAIYAGLSSDYVKSYDALTKQFKISGGADGSDTLVNVEIFQFSDGALSANQIKGFADSITGTKKANVLNGSIGADHIKGLKGNDVLNGNAGDDQLNGGQGDDTLTGGAGADVFSFTDNRFGNDVIADFVDGIDKLKFSGNISDIFSDFTITNNGTSEVLITFDDNSIILRNMSAITITEADMLFI